MRHLLTVAFLVMLVVPIAQIKLGTAHPMYWYTATRSESLQSVSNAESNASGQQVVNMLSFGLVGDGTVSGTVVRGTDNTAALQAAVNYCAQNGKRCYLPSAPPGHCYAFTHIYLDDSGGRNPGWPSQVTSFQMFGDGMESQYNMITGAFQRSTLCSTDTAEPAIQVNVFGSVHPGVYYERGYWLHDFNVWQDTSSSVFALEQVIEDSVIQRVGVEQRGTGGGIYWANLYSNSGVRESRVTGPETAGGACSRSVNSKGIWLFNNDPSAPGGGIVYDDHNVTVCFDRGNQVGVVKIAGALNVDPVRSSQLITSVDAQKDDSEANNYEFVFAYGVQGLHLDAWHSEGGKVDGIVVTNGAQGVMITAGDSYEPSLTGYEVLIEGGSAAAGGGIVIAGNLFTAVKTNGIGHVLAYSHGIIYGNVLTAVNSRGTTCFNVVNPSTWTEIDDLCSGFGTVSTDTTHWQIWSPYQGSTASSYVHTFNGNVNAENGYLVNGTPITSTNLSDGKTILRYCGTARFSSSTTSKVLSCSWVTPNSHCTATWVGSTLTGGALGLTAFSGRVAVAAANANSGAAAVYCSIN